MEVERVDNKAFRALSLGQMAILYCLLRVNMDFQLSSHSTVRDCNPLLGPGFYIYKTKSLDLKTKNECFHKIKGQGMGV